MTRALADRLTAAETSNSHTAWERVETAAVGTKEFLATMIRAPSDEVNAKPMQRSLMVVESLHGQPPVDLWPRALVRPRACGAAHAGHVAAFSRAARDASLYRSPPRLCLKK